MVPLIVQGKLGKIGKLGIFICLLEMVNIQGSIKGISALTRVQVA